MAETTDGGMVPIGEPRPQKPVYLTDRITGPTGELPSVAAEREREAARRAVDASRLSRRTDRQDEVPLVEADEIIDQEPEKEWGNAESASKEVSDTIDVELENNGGGEPPRQEVPINNEQPRRRTFREIQNDLLLRLIIGPDPAEELRLKLERARLLREAKDAGVFKSLKDHMEEVQRSKNFDEAGKSIRNINIANLENEARGNPGWSDDFEFMLSEYRDVALINMRLALAKARGNGNEPVAKRLEREIEIRGWGFPPANLERLARDYIEGKKITPSKESKIPVTRIEKTGYAGEIERRAWELKEKGATPVEWARLVINGISYAERESATERKRSEEMPDYWKAIEEAIGIIPEGVGRMDRSSQLAKFFSKEYPQGLNFKERLGLLLKARKHLNDRYIEITRSGGSLVRMGLGAGDVPFEGITYKVQFMGPEDDYFLYHMNEQFPELAGIDSDEARELLPDLDSSSGIWLDIGIRNSSLPDVLLKRHERIVIQKILDNKALIINYHQSRFRARQISQQELSEITRDVNRMAVGSNWLGIEAFMEPLIRGRVLSPNEVNVFASIPTFNNSLNLANRLAELRSRVVDVVRSRSSEELSFRNLKVKLTFDLLDRERSGVQGSSEARDLMWVERKRLYEIEKEREPGLDWTVGRYFVSSPDQADVIKERDASRSTKLRKRKETLQVNVERGILVERRDYWEGQVVSDYFHNVMVFVPDALSPGKTVRRNFASYILNADGTIKPGGFKKIPFLSSGPESDTIGGYWGYTLAKAQQLATEISSVTYKRVDEELETDDWWNKKRDLFARLEHISPRFIIGEYKERGEIIRQLLQGVGGFDANEIKKIVGFSSSEDLDVISDLTKRDEAVGLVLARGKQISKDASDRWSKKQRDVIDKFRLVHALGVVWPGSLDSEETYSGFLQQSSISPQSLNKIIRAIAGARYLEGDYLDQFKLEAQEMGFGGRLLGRGKRYRLPVNRPLWG